MAVDMFLKLTGVEGESIDKSHKGEISVLSFSWGEANQGSGAFGTGQGTGKVSMSDFTFMMRMCKATPVLMLKCASGEHIDEALLTCRKAGTTPLEYLKIKFTKVFITSYQTGASTGGDEYPIDSISAGYEEVEWEYTPQDEKGKALDPIKGGWLLKENVAK